MDVGEVTNGKRLSRRIAEIAVIVFAVAGLVTLLAIGLINRTAVTGLSGFRLIQKPAPQFQLNLLDRDGQFATEDANGQPMVINFWSSWCAPCREESPLLEKTWQDYKDKDVQFVGVQIQDTEQAGRDYIREFDITFPTGLDTDGSVTIDYGVIGIPVTFFVNREGVVERRFVGAIKETQLVEWIEELIAGVAPSGDVEGENTEGFFNLN